MPEPFPLPLYLPVESHVRELDAKILLAAVAAERGRTVFLGEQNALRATMPFGPRGIYIHKSFSPRHRWLQADHFRIQRDMGYVVLGWDEEGLVHLPEDIYAVRRVGPEPLASLQAVFSWGPNYTRLFKSLPYYDGTPVFETGNPRRDLYRPSVRSYFVEDVRALNKRFGAFLLINSNFGRINPAVRRSRDGSASGRKSSTAVDKTWHDIVGYRRKLYAAFRDMLGQLAVAFPERQIVLRPHPAERLESWHDISSQFSNVHVLHEGTAAPWILASDVLIHNGCTTALEAALLDRPSITYAPFPVSDLDWQLPNSVSHQAHSISELVEAIRLKPVSKTKQPDKRDTAEILNAHIAATGEKLACDAIMETIESHEGVWAASRSLHRRPIGVARGLLRVAEKSWQRFKADSHSQNSTSFLDRQFPPFAESDIALRLERFRSTTGRFVRVRVHKTGHKLFCFTSPTT